MFLHLFSRDRPSVSWLWSPSYCTYCSSMMSSMGSSFKSLSKTSQIKVEKRVFGPPESRGYFTWCALWIRDHGNLWLLLESDHKFWPEGFPYSPLMISQIRKWWLESIYLHIGERIGTILYSEIAEGYEKPSLRRSDLQIIPVFDTLGGSRTLPLFFDLQTKKKVEDLRLTFTNTETNKMDREEKKTTKKELTRDETSALRTHRKRMRKVCWMTSFTRWSSQARVWKGASKRPEQSSTNFEFEDVVLFIRMEIDGEE